MLNEESKIEFDDDQNLPFDLGNCVNTIKNEETPESDSDSYKQNLSRISSGDTDSLINEEDKEFDLHLPNIADFHSI